MSARLSRRHLLVGAAALPTVACGSNGAANAMIHIRTDARGPTVPTKLFGSNLQWTSFGDGVLLPVAGGEFVWNSALLGLAAEAGVTLLRFPGGALANTYRWRSGVGPRSQRPNGKNFTGANEASIFGSDELIHLAEKTGVEPLLTVNASAGAEEAAAWVEYMNGGKDTPLGAQRALNTGAMPVGVRWWEVGNELYSPKEPGHLAPGAYARTVMKFRGAMRRRDPTIKVGAMLEGSFQSAAWMAAVIPELTVWNAAVLAECAREIDFVSLHFSAPYDTVWPDGRLLELTLAATLVLRKTLIDIRSELARLGRPQLPILLTEYTPFFGGPRSELVSGEAGALFDALVLFELMRQPTVAAAANWSLSNNGAFGLVAGEGERLERRATFETFRRLRTFGGRPTVATEISGPTLSISAKGSVPAFAAVPMVDGMTVVVSPGRYRLGLVNRSAGTTVTCRLDGAFRLIAGDKAPLDSRRSNGDALTLSPRSLTFFELTS